MNSEPETLNPEPPLPSERATVEEIASAREALLRNDVALSMLEAVQDMAMVLTPTRQVIAANRSVTARLGLGPDDDLLGCRPGEVLACANAGRAPGGCGASDACGLCGAATALFRCVLTRRPASSECRIRTASDDDGGALDVRATAVPLECGPVPLIVLSLRDISGDKRRALLERVFFHDVLNVATGVRAVAEILNDADADAETDVECRQALSRLATALHDEIKAQQHLAAAETGDLQPDLSDVSVPALLQSVLEQYHHHTVARGRTITITEAPPSTIRTDPTLLRRVLGNLLKNALEAEPEGSTVTLSAERVNADLLFHIANPRVMPDDVQKQLFQRSFTTKPGSGHGIGTHSVKLLTERYLGGEVTFTSHAPEGTRFTVRLPGGFE